MYQFLLSVYPVIPAIGKELLFLFDGFLHILLIEHIVDEHKANNQLYINKKVECSITV